jgi:hypothetical protein
MTRKTLLKVDLVAKDGTEAILFNNINKISGEHLKEILCELNGEFVKRIIQAQESKIREVSNA